MTRAAHLNTSDRLTDWRNVLINRFVDRVCTPGVLGCLGGVRVRNWCSWLYQPVFTDEIEFEMVLHDLTFDWIELRLIHQATCSHVCFMLTTI